MIAGMSNVYGIAVHNVFIPNYGVFQNQFSVMKFVECLVPKAAHQGCRKAPRASEMQLAEPSLHMMAEAVMG